MAAAHFISKLSSSNLVLQCHCQTAFEPHHSSPQILTPKNFKSSFLGTKVFLQASASALRPRSLSKICPRVVTVSLSLPTAKPERVSSSDQFPKWSSKAIRSFALSEVETRKLNYTSIGTQAIIMGILVEGTSLASKFLRANGITLFKVHEETLKLLGEADVLSYYPPQPPLTDDTLRALDWAVDQKIKSGDGGEITTIHLLLGIWSEVESPGHKILSNLGFDDEKAKKLESIISKPGFTDD